MSDGRTPQAMAEVWRASKDTEAQAFYALALLATAPPEDATHANQKRAAALLEPIYRYSNLSIRARRIT